LPFSEKTVLFDLLPYLKKTLGLSNAEVMTVEEARSEAHKNGYNSGIIDSSEPGAPAFEYYNS
jgi:leucyl-tRNA synthetase